MKKYFKQFGGFKDAIYDFIFPKKCVGCQDEGEWLCEKCFEKIIVVRAPFCPFCKKLTKLGQYCRRCRKYYHLTGVIIAAHYEDPLREAIHKYKYNKIKELADPLFELIAKRLELGFPRGDLVLVPIPLARAREQERGFNQSELLARRISDNFEIDLVLNILFRIKDRPAQVELKGRARKENVRGIFAVRGDLEKIKNKTVLLVDDVFTTGATLNEAARVLKRGGAKNIWGLVVAKS